MCCTDYSACVFASIWSIVQSFFHLGWSIWGTYMYDCVYNLNNNSFNYFWYLTYFYTNSCVNATLENLLVPRETDHLAIPMNSGDLLIPPLLSTNVSVLEMYLLEKSRNIEFPPESAAAYRTNSIFKAYIIVNVLWIIAAVALLVGACFRIRENWSVIFFFPWTVVLLVILFFDGVAAGWYGIDISYTYDIKNWFIFMGGKDQSDVDELGTRYLKIPSSSPSVLMMVLFSRFFVIWLINLFLFFRIVQAAVNAVEDFDDEESRRSKCSNQGQSGKVDVVNNQRPRHFQVRDIHPNSSSARIRRWQLYYGTDDEDEKEEKAVYRHPRRTSKQKNSTGNDGWQKDNAFRYNNTSVSGSGQNLAVIGGYEGDRSNSPSPLPDHVRRQIRNPYKNRYSSGYESNDVCFSFNEQQASSSSKSPEYVEIYEQEMSQQVCVRELRGQLPWSYFHDRNDVAVPKGRTYNDTLPPVPVPDYTLKFNNKNAKKVNVF